MMGRCSECIDYLKTNGKICGSQGVTSSVLCAFSLAEALAKVKDQNISHAFRDLFLPNGQPPLSGLFTRRMDLAAILDAVAVNGIADFYSGNLTQEMATAVRKHISLSHRHM